MNTSVWDFQSASLRLFTQIFKLYACETYFLNHTVLGQGTGCLVLIIMLYPVNGPSHKIGVNLVSGA